MKWARNLSVLNPYSGVSFEGSVIATTEPDSARNWNLAVILRGDYEFRLSEKSYFGSGSLDSVL